MQINLTKSATFVTADSKGVCCCILCEFPQGKTGDLAGQGFLQGMAGIPKASADLSKFPLPPLPQSHYGACHAALNLILPMSLDRG